MHRKYARENERLEQLKMEATKITQNLSGMPGGGSKSDKTAIAAEIADCDTILASIKQQEIAEYNRLVRYIASIDDCYIRQIIEKRFVELKSWPTVAREMGGNNTRDSVRMAVNRFLRKN